MKKPDETTKIIKKLDIIDKHGEWGQVEATSGPRKGMRFPAVIKENFHTKFKKGLKNGQFDQQIKKAKIDYANGRALDTLY